VREAVGYPDSIGTGRRLVQGVVQQGGGGGGGLVSPPSPDNADGGGLGESMPRRRLTAMAHGNMDGNGEWLMVDGWLSLVIDWSFGWNGLVVGSRS
jgi:hypothetical protein